MYTRQPKKLLIMNILDILRRYSDANHRLSQKEIVELLKSKYEMDADRKSVKRNLMNLIDFGYNIEYTETVRRGRDGEEEIIYTDWYLLRDFSDAELRLLIDSLLFSKHIPHRQCRRLIEKIEGLSNNYFKSKVRHVSSLPVTQLQNAELFYTVEMLDEAIEKKRQVTFLYCDYGTDKKLHPRINKDGGAKVYKVNPYQMVTSNGRYYLIANADSYENISHYRLDRIREIEIAEDYARPLRSIKEFENGLDLPKHMAEHIYMFSGESARVTMKTQPWMASDLIDWFGDGVEFSDETENCVTATVTANLQAMRFWALQYSPFVTVVSPKGLVEEIKENLREALGKYE